MNTKQKLKQIIVSIILLIGLVLAFRGGERCGENSPAHVIIPCAHSDEIKFGTYLKYELSYTRTVWNINHVDLDRLARAVARHETADCTKGTARYNNCFGIMHWPNGKRTPKRYATKEDSYKDFKDLWSRKYGGFPDLRMAIKYSGNDRAKIWLRNVKIFYNQ